MPPAMIANGVDCREPLLFPGMVTPSSAMLACHRLRISVPGRVLVDNLAMTLAAGEFLAVLGQNGSGKSLTLHTLAGLRDRDSGDIELGGQPLDAMKRIDVARRLALLPQYTDDVFPATVLDTALAGRHPHLRALQWETATDRDIARRSLEAMDLAALEHRDVGTLSGGERRRLAIAEVLAQAPDVYLLDEPTNHLDPQHQLKVLQVFAEHATAGATVVASLHDVNLAARYADRCLLLFGDGRWKLGATREVLNSNLLSELYDTRMEPVPWRGRELFVAADSAP